MYQLLIILICLLRSLITKYITRRSQLKLRGQITQEQQQSELVQRKAPLNETPLQVQLRLIKQRQQQILSTMEQYNNPSTFAKYSKMQRQLMKLNSQGQNLEEEIKKQTGSQQSLNQAQDQSNQVGSLLQQRKKQVQNIHKQMANKEMLVKAFINLALIIGFSYFQTSELSVCAGYPSFIFCNDSAKINGAWVFVFSSVVFSY